MTACGSSDEEKLYDKYEDIISDLESNKFDDAANKVIELLEKYNESTEAEKLDPEEKEYIELLCSDWIGSNYEDPIDVSFFEDGRCTVGDTELHWSLRESNENWAEFALNDGATVLYTLDIDKTEEAVRAILFDCSEGEYSPSIASYYSAKDFTRLDVTVENFYDYFELVTSVETAEDSFGDVVSMSVYYKYFLKETYGTVNSDLSNIAIEYAYVEPRYELDDLDLEEGIYEIGDPAPFSSEEEIYTYDTSMYSEYDTERYGFHVGSTWMQADSEYVYVPEITEILRMAGSIYVYNSAE